MARLPPDAENSRELDRLNAFSDGVFAVAITLLVLNIETPKVDEDDLWSALSDLGGDLYAYFLAFAIIGMFWYGHAAMLSHLERTSGRLMVVNLFLLSTIALLPFSTSLIGGYGDSELATCVFALNLGVAATADSLMDQVAMREELYVPGEEPDRRILSIEGILRPLVFLISVPLAFVDTTVAEVFWLTLFILPEIAGMISRRMGSPASP
jgi:uncharacterized membrane protein